jgi:ABC-type antimicrobial peptide transport system permease subunit
MKENWRVTMSSSAGFPVSDLLRRKTQTGLTVTTLTLSVASTLFLLQFSSRLGVGFASQTSALTLGLTAFFGQFLLFIGVLIFIIGAVLTSISVFLMMSQRTRDFALIKAVGCPNSLVGGYFMTELLTVTLLSTTLGIVFGFLADFIVAQMVFSSYVSPILWYPILIFVAFFVLSFFFGLHPILKAAKLSALEALSPVTYYGLAEEAKHQPFSRRALTWRIALRSLYRRQAATIRIIFLLSTVFVLLTVSVAGGIIASDTSISSIEKPIGKDAVAIGQIEMINQFKSEVEKFSQKAEENNDFNYSNPQYAIPNVLIQQLHTLDSVALVDSRLVLYEAVAEKPSIALGRSTADTFDVGGYRKGKSIVIGLNPAFYVGSWSMKGRFLDNNAIAEAVVGDSIAETMYVRDLKAGINMSNPLLEGISIANSDFKIVGVCIDPINNGYITYVPIDALQRSTGIYHNNLLIIKLNNSTERDTAISEIETMDRGYGLAVYDLNLSVEKNASFLSSTWQTIMFLPSAILASAAICLVTYMMLSVNEQLQEFAIIRAIGAKPNIIVSISAIQSFIVLLSSSGIGLSFGTIITFMILIANPTFTPVTILAISGWILVALTAMFSLSLYPAFRAAKKPILEIMTQ